MTHLPWNHFSQMSQQIQNSQFNPDGSLNQSRILPRNAGFGAATGAINLGSEVGLGNNYTRAIQFTVRFQF